MDLNSYLSLPVVSGNLLSKHIKILRKFVLPCCISLADEIGGKNGNTWTTKYIIHSCHIVLGGMVFFCFFVVFIFFSCEVAKWESFIRGRNHATRGEKHCVRNQIPCMSLVEWACILNLYFYVIWQVLCVCVFTCMWLHVKARGQPWSFLRCYSP